MDFPLPLKNGFGQCRGLFSHLRAKIWKNGLYICPEEPQGGGREVMFVKLPIYSPSLAEGLKFSRIF